MSILGGLTKGLGIVTGVISRLPGIIEMVEKVSRIFKGDVSGPEKHQLAVELARDTIMEMEEFSGKEIADEQKFSAGLDKAIAGVVEMRNALKKE